MRAVGAASTPGLHCWRWSKPVFRRWKGGVSVEHGHEYGGDYLATRESDGYYPQLVACGEEFGGNCGRRGHYCLESCRNVE